MLFSSDCKTARGLISSCRSVCLVCHKPVLNAGEGEAVTGVVPEAASMLLKLIY